MTDIEQKVVQHDEQIKTLFRRTDKMDVLLNQINSLAISIKELTTNQTQMLEQQKNLKEDVDKIKNKESNDAHDLKMTIIKCVITGVIGAILGAIFAMIFKS